MDTTDLAFGGGHDQGVSDDAAPSKRTVSVAGCDARPVHKCQTLVQRFVTSPLERVRPTGKSRQ